MNRVKEILPLIAGLLLAGFFLTTGITSEPPVGTVEGTVVMAESGRPLSNVEVTLSPVDYEQGLRDRYISTDKQGFYRIRDVAVGQYTVNVSATAHAAKDRKFAIVEGRNPLDMALPPKPPSLELHIDQHVFAPGKTPAVHVSGFVPQKDVTVSITRLDPAKVAQSGGLEGEMNYLSSAERLQGPEHYGKRVSDQRHPLYKDVEGAFVQRLTLPKLPEGIYWVECSANGLRASSYLNITHIALIGKFVNRKALAYAVDFTTGEPLPNVAIFTHTAQGYRQNAKTNAYGLANVVFDKLSKKVFVAQEGDAIAVCSQQYDNMREHQGPETVFLYTDRSIYRPGDTVQFKGLARRRNGVEYSLPKASKVDLLLTDGDQNVLAHTAVFMSAHGSFHSQFTMSKELAPGYYHVEARMPEGAGRVAVEVADYRKPDYSITVLPDKSSYYLGDTAKVTVQASYFYGGPVVGAKVHANVFRETDWQRQFQDDEGDTGDTTDEHPDFSGGSYEQNIDTVTDATGRATIEVPTRSDDDDPDQVDQDFIYTINADVTDVGDKQFTGSGSFRVTRGDMKVNVSTFQRIAAAGAPVDVEATVTRQDDAQSPVPGKLVELTVGRQVSDEDETTTFQGDTKMSATTDEHGIAHFTIVAGDHASVDLRASIKDGGGRTIIGDAYLYVSGALDEQNRSNLTATLNLRQYKIGDTAKLLINTSDGGGCALVTVQAEDIQQRWVVQLNKNGGIMSLPVTKEMSPNAFVSLAYIKRGHFEETETQINVLRVNRTLQVTVTPDRSTVKPDESVTYDVFTADGNGHPVSADASLSVVDEAIFAIRKERTDIRKGFYPYRQDYVMTSYSFPEVYMDGGDKGTGKMQVRSRFLDTASWTADVETGADGHAKVRVSLPDNLTRWRATAVACTDNATVGMGTSDVTARKPLMVTIQPPTFMVVGDDQRVAVTVTNDTGHDADVRFSVSLAGLRNSAEIPKTLHVASGHPETVALDVSPTASGTATLTAAAVLANGNGDAVRMPLRVLPHALTTVQTTAGDSVGEIKFSMTRSPNADLNTGGLRLTLSNSIAAGLLDSLSGLIDYPYGCTEQTMSRFMPSVVLTSAFKKMGMGAPPMASTLPEIANDSFTRLGRLQHTDGSWGWWEYDAGDEYMTALALDGLRHARDAGYPPPSYIHIKQALDWAQRTFKASPTEIDFNRQGRIYLAWMLAEYGRKQVAERALAHLGTQNLGSSDLALLALANAAVGKSAKAQIDELTKRVVVRAGTARWQNKYDYEWGVESNAFILMAYATVEPDNPLIPSIVRGLMEDRRGAMWDSTRETSYAIVAITQYLLHTHEAQQSESIDVVVAGRIAATVEITPARPQQVIELPIRSIPPGNFDVELRHRTPGRVSYSVALTQAPAAERLVASTPVHGFWVTRRYFVLSPQKLSDGTMRLLPSAKPVDKAPSGSVIQCEITVRSARPRQYLMIECPIPSNCHITDRDDPLDGEAWSWWWSRTVIRSDRISFFSTYMDRGEQKITFMMQAESPGKASALPVTAENMYDPGERATSDESPFEVTR